MPTCLHCNAEYTPAPDLILGCCPSCTARHPEIASLGFQLTVDEARRVLAGTLPGRVRALLQELVRAYEEGL